MGTKWRAVSVPTQKSNGDLPRGPGVVTASPGRTSDTAPTSGPVMAGRSSGRKPATAAIISTLNIWATPDTPAIGITGDIDLAVVYEPATSYGAATGLISRWDTVFGGLRSYVLSINANKTIEIRWSTDGTAELAMESTTAIPEPADGYPLGVRAQLDVNDGGGNRVATFLTSLDLGATWTQLGNVVTTAGATSIFDGTAGLVVGGISGGFVGVSGVYYEAWVRNGIGGSLVANPRFKDQPPRQPSFRDDQANVWSPTGSALIAVVG